MIWLWSLLLLLLIAAWRYWLKARMWHPENDLIMLNKTVIVTGANTGIGLETAAALAGYGAKVIMACRDSAKASIAKEYVINQLRARKLNFNFENRVITEDLDLADFSSIRNFAQKMQKLPRLDVLINNAGVVFMTEKMLTSEGLEVTMGTNHFGHFLLTQLLLPLLKKSAPSRIIVVSSDAHRFGKIAFDDLNCERSFGCMKSYANSKLANVLFTRELARRLENTGVIVNALHPGLVISEAWRHLPKWVVMLYKHVMRFVCRTPLEGAQTVIYLAASQSAEAMQSGGYFIDCRLVQPSAQARDDASANILWKISERITSTGKV